MAQQRTAECYLARIEKYPRNQRNTRVPTRQSFKRDFIGYRVFTPTSIYADGIDAKCYLCRLF